MKLFNDTASIMKARSGDVLHFRRTSSGYITIDLICGDNYLRNTDYGYDSIFENYVGEYFDMGIIKDIIRDYDGGHIKDTDVDKLWDSMYIKYIGILTLNNNNSTSYYIGEARRNRYNHLLSRIFDYYTSPPTENKVYQNFHLTDQWNTVINLSASDGAKHIGVDDKYVMYMFNGLIPASKKNEINLHIMDNNKYPYFLAEFEVINRKKTKTIDTIISAYTCIVFFFRL